MQGVLILCEFCVQVIRNKMNTNWLILGIELIRQMISFDNL